MPVVARNWTDGAGRRPVDFEASWYHGSCRWLPRFEHRARLPVMGISRMYGDAPQHLGVWLSESAEVAEGFARDRFAGETPCVVEVRVAVHSPRVYQTYLDFLTDFMRHRDVRRFRRELRREGHDAVLIEESDTDTQPQIIRRDLCVLDPRDLQVVTTRGRSGRPNAKTPRARTPRDFHSAFRRWLRSEPIFGLIAQCGGPLAGTDWTAGCCFALAEVLHRWSGRRWPKWVILGHTVAERDWHGEIRLTMWGTEHVVVATPWGFLDGDGFSSRETQLRRIRRAYPRSPIHEPTRLGFRMLPAAVAEEELGDVLGEEGGESCPVRFVRELLVALRKDMGELQDWGLGSTE